MVKREGQALDFMSALALYVPLGRSGLVSKLVMTRKSLFGKQSRKALDFMSVLSLFVPLISYSLANVFVIRKFTTIGRA